MSFMMFGKACIVTLFLAQTIAGQNPPTVARPGLVPREGIQDVPWDGASLRTTYMLGPNDSIQIRIPESDELNEKTFRIESDGNVSLPMLGRIRAGGMTIEAFEQVLLREIQPYIKASRVIVSLAQFRTEAVYLLGAFKTPGSFQLLEHRKIVDVVALGGGLAPSASRRLRMTRRASVGPIPLPKAVIDPDRGVSTVDITFNSLMDVDDPAENIMLMPFDTITAPRTEMVYISGEVAKPGGYELNDRDSITVTQALALVGGLSREAKPEKARILRPIMDTNRRAEIPVDLTKVLSGLASDFPLMPNDALFVPRAPQRKTAVSQVLMYTIPAVLVALVVSAIQ